MTEQEKFFFNHGYAQAKRDYGKRIEDIKAEILRNEFTHHDGFEHWYMDPQEIKEMVLSILDKHVGGVNK